MAEAAWSRENRGASRGGPDARTLQPASGSRSRRLPRGRQREAQASRRQSQGGGFREPNGRKLPGSNGRPIGKLKRFIGGRFRGLRRETRPVERRSTPKAPKPGEERSRGVPANPGRGWRGRKVPPSASQDEGVQRRKGGSVAREAPPDRMPAKLRVEEARARDAKLRSVRVRAPEQSLSSCVACES